MGKRRRVGNPLALAVLSVLVGKPRHPYEMASEIRGRGKEASMKIKWGTLYSVVDSLERHQLIKATGTARDGRRPERTVYEITDAGHAELLDWVRELVGTHEKEYRRFEAGLSMIGVVPPDDAVALLRGRIDDLDRAAADLDTQLRDLAATLPRIFLVEAEYDLAMMRAEAAWIRSLLADLDAGRLSGADAWRHYHESGELPTTWTEPDEEDTR